MINRPEMSLLPQNPLLDDETIRRHVEDYCKKLKIKPENGESESKLTETETQALIAHLYEVTYLYVKDVCAYFQSTFGKKYSVCRKKCLLTERITDNFQVLHSPLFAT